MQIDGNQLSEITLITYCFFYLRHVVPPTFPRHIYHRFTIHMLVRLAISCRSTVTPFISFCLPRLPAVLKSYRFTGWTFIFDNGRTPATIKPFDRGRLSAIGGPEGWVIGPAGATWPLRKAPRKLEVVLNHPQHHIGRRKAVWFRLSSKSSGMRRVSVPFAAPGHTVPIVSLLLLSSSSLSLSSSLFPFVSNYFPYCHATSHEQPRTI